MAYFQEACKQPKLYTVRHVDSWSGDHKTNFGLDVIKGFDARDPTSLSNVSRSRIVDLTASQRRMNRLRIGVPVEYNIEELDPVVRNTWVRTLRSFKDAGHEIIPTSLATTKQALSTYYVLAPSEAYSNLARYDGVRYGTREDGPDDSAGVLYANTRAKGFGEEVKRRILLGTYTLSAKAINNYFIQAQKIRRLVQLDFNKIFHLPNALLTSPGVGIEEGVQEEGVDVLVCPTAPTLAPTLESVAKQDPLEAYMNDVFTIPASLAGLPAISVPVLLDGSEDTKGVRSQTVGMQIIGQYGDDEGVLKVANLLEAWNSPSAEPGSL